MMFQNKMTSTIPIPEINIRHVDGMALQEWAGMGLTDVRERESVCVSENDVLHIITWYYPTWKWCIIHQRFSRCFRAMLVIFDAVDHRAQ